VRKLLSGAVMIACAYLWSSCTPTQPTPGDVIVSQTVTVGGQTGTPGASPSPGAGGSLPEGSRIAIFQFGQSCPSGVTVPANGTRQCKMGCTCDYTCTPKGPDGTDLPEAVHGPTATWAVEFGQDRVSVQRDNFNLRVRPVAPGEFGLACTVKNLTGRVDASVISSAADVVAMDGQPLPPGPPAMPGPMGPGK